MKFENHIQKICDHQQSKVRTQLAVRTTHIPFIHSREKWVSTFSVKSGILTAYFVLYHVFRGHRKNARWSQPRIYYRVSLVELSSFNLISNTKKTFLEAVAAIKLPQIGEDPQRLMTLDQPNNCQIRSFTTSHSIKLSTNKTGGLFLNG